MPRKLLTYLSLLGAATAGLSATSMANAAVIINPDGSATFDNTGGANTVLVTYNGLGGDPKALVPGLSALLTLTLDSVVSNVYNFTYSMLNTSTVTGAGVSGFGFDVSPNVTSISSTGFFGDSALNANFASYAAEVCFNGGPGACPQASGPNRLNPFAVGGNGTFGLTFAGSPSSITLSNFLDRYQGFSTTNVNGSSVSSAVGRGSIFPSIVGSVPEPSTWLMMIFGFGAIGAILRRHQGRDQTNGRIKPSLLGAS